ncbi:lipase chaperone [Alteromonas macleodii]|uniref:lipase secretion chaperone n=1 Tax=Alteromonas macleodii TaxID=28108 RepID=UPI0005806A10|nr:lipase chaperone family protein [Alteromonas macleodii]KHT48796.1 lipase chaperone [Alteromonas macleodii]
MEKRQFRRVFPILGGLLALLVFGAILYNQLASESQTSNSEIFSQRSSLGEQAKAGEYELEGGGAVHQVTDVGSHRDSDTDIAADLIPFELNYSTKDAFDRFVFARTSEVPQAVKLAYTTHAHEVFTLSTQGDAIDLFARYVDYKVALSLVELDVDLASHSLQDVSFKLDEREEIRRTYFNNTEYHYLFSQEAQVDEAALARLSVAQENTLSRDERKALIVESIKAGNSAEREAFQPTLNMHRINEIKNNHSTINDRYNAVAAEFGSEVAERFSKTWAQQAQWQNRIAEYKTFRDNLAQQSLDSNAIEKALQEYQSAHFTDNEIKRLKVLTAL